MIYCLEDHRGCPRYVGWSADLDKRVCEHWKKRGSTARRRENPALCDWLSSLLFPPSARVLAVVPWARRYSEERHWTLVLGRKYALTNVSIGAAPLKRGPLDPEHKAKISLALLERNRRSGPPPHGTAAA